MTDTILYACMDWKLVGTKNWSPKIILSKISHCGDAPVGKAQEFTEETKDLKRCMHINYTCNRVQCE